MTSIKIGVTGADGFIGRHLLAKLNVDSSLVPIPVPREALANEGQLREIVGGCHAIVHLAAMNRGDDRQLFETNVGLTRKLCHAVAEAKQPVHVIFASSTQRESDSAYGRSKRDAEAILKKFCKDHGFPASICVIPNIFGPGCRPFYNSVVATFCHQLAHKESPRIDVDKTLSLMFVGDLAARMVEIAKSIPSAGCVTLSFATGSGLAVSEILEKLRGWQSRYFGDGVIPHLETEFDRQLYATFLSHIPPQSHRHCPQVHTDERGSLFEIIRTMGGGQVFFSTTKPGVIRGEHFHTRKVEWFCVVQGEAIIRIRRIGTRDVEEFRVSGKSPQFISIPAFHTHHIENCGAEELMTMFWCSELFEKADPDTYFEKVA
jgi:UDP-2-acetamido-2,6-beta-L-arabino-hexul-4-ose reductase